MHPLSPKQILSNLENGYFMTHQEQEEAAQLIRQLQQSNNVLRQGNVMKEARELQTLIDALERHIAQQDKEIDRLKDINNPIKNSAEPCKCIDEFWCATFDRCKRNED